MFLCDPSQMHAHLTVLETLRYTARLRMPRSHTPADRDTAITRVIHGLGLAHCTHVIVGDSRAKGVSGGERKRLAIAMELLTSPQLLFLDEPTSGLDSTTALSIMLLLKDLASGNVDGAGKCTVVATIHQPQSKIFKLLDNLVLMDRGSMSYQVLCLNLSLSRF